MSAAHPNPTPRATSASASQSSTTVAARYFNAYRIASYLIVLYALGHTLGTVVNTPAFGPESDAVASTMKSVHVFALGSDCTWYGWFRGFAANISVNMLFSAFLAWHLGGVELRDRRSFAPVIWALVLSWVAGSVIAWVYFFRPPIAFSFVIMALLVFACVRDAHTEFPPR